MAQTILSGQTLRTGEWMEVLSRVLGGVSNGGQPAQHCRNTMRQLLKGCAAKAAVLARTTSAAPLCSIQSGLEVEFTRRRSRPRKEPREGASGLHDMQPGSYLFWVSNMYLDTRVGV